MLAGRLEIFALLVDALSGHLVRQAIITHSRNIEKLHQRWSA
jgi:hypothetical protein